MNAIINIDAATVAILLRRRDGTILETLIDAEDLPRIYGFHWMASRHPSGCYYAVAAGGKGILARIIMDAPPGMVVDHVFHDTLDNRKSRLRVVTNQENILNRRGAASDNRTSGIRGVNAASYDPSKFQARVKVKGVSHYLGVYADKATASEAVERKLAELGVPGHA